MSIENLLTNLIKALQDNTAAMTARATPKTDLGMPAPIPAAPAPIPAAPAPIPAAPAPAPAVPAATGMPAAPFAVPEAPAPAPAPVPTAPFHDTAGLMQYVGTAYNKLGSAKGSMILDILRGFGIDNISSLPHAMYGEFYARIEELLK